MKIRTQELIGPALDWAVAQSEGLPLKLDPMGFRKDYPGSAGSGWWVWFGTSEGLVVGHRMLHRGREQGYSPSTDWAQGGPIIAREGIGMLFDAGSACKEPAWFATPDDQQVSHGYEGENFDPAFMVYEADGCYGPTILIAAMRCLVASRLGEEVEVPEELLET